jgi:hypothetical protein
VVGARVLKLPWRGLRSGFERASKTSAATKGSKLSFEPLAATRHHKGLARIMEPADHEAPVDDLCIVTPYPDVRATEEAVQLSALTANVPAVLHLYTG